MTKRLISSTAMIIIAGSLGLAPTLAFANSSNPKFPVTCTQGGSSNPCPTDASTDNGGVSTKQNPAGNNKTCTTSVDNKCQ